MRWSLRVAVFVAVVSFGTACSAAVEINEINGKVMISRGGHGFVPVKHPTTGNIGDAVYADKTSSAVVIYDDGCRVSVDPGEVVHVRSTSPCKAGPLANHDDRTFVIGGLAIGGAAAAIIGLAKNDHQASP